jgi:hypothetical protein
MSDHHRSLDRALARTEGIACTCPADPPGAQRVNPKCPAHGVGLAGEGGRVPTTLAAVLAEAFDEWLFRMHGVTSSCQHEVEGDGLAETVLASDWLAAHDAAVRARAAAEALREAAGDWPDRDDAYALPDEWLRARAGEAQP